MLSCDEQIIKTENKLIAAVIPWVSSYRKIKKNDKTFKSKYLSIPLLLHRLLLGCPSMFLILLASMKYSKNYLIILISYKSLMYM